MFAQSSIFITHTHTHALRLCEELYGIRINSRGLSWPGVNPLISGERAKESGEIMCAFVVLEVGTGSVILT